MGHGKTSIRLGITMGDPAGIGPEVAVRALDALAPALHGVQLVVYGHAWLFDGVDAELVEPEVAPGGAVRPEREAIEHAAADLASGALDGVVTGPVDKACFGGEFPGHTELFAARCGVDDWAMMLAGPRLSVVAATTHVALREVPGLVSVEETVRLGRLLHRSLRSLDLHGAGGLEAPRIAVAGLNPHASDGGLFGDEEAQALGPAVERLVAEGIGASGPWSPDTVYHRAVRGDFDCVLAPYHDQALVPFKLLHFSDGVNVTLGLPRPRTSPDHGPAYDLAGRGGADATSMERAIGLALRMIQR